MNPDAIEPCLQAAAEQSSAWALIRETDKPAWVLVLADETLVDIACDERGEHLVLRAELGLVHDAEQRAAINDLVLRCMGVLPMPTICLDQDNRYETVTHWRIDLMNTPGLAALFEDVSAQVKLWRDVVAKPLTSAGVSTPQAPTVDRAPTFGAFA